MTIKKIQRENQMIIGFDADDTLWQNEINYFEAERKLLKIVNPWYKGDDLESEIFQTEMSNLELFGYGAKGFTLSLIETALRVSDNRISGKEVEKIIGLGKDLIKKPVLLLEGVKDTLSELASLGYTLLFITKGDLLDQKRKLAHSGLKDSFSHIEIMSGKTVDDYRDFFKRVSVDPSAFIMVGDSLKSDILPVLELGGWAVHIPGNSRWQHEKVDKEIHYERFIKGKSIGDIVSIVAKIEKENSIPENSVLEIYTDGGCSGNPGPGGWAYVLSFGTHEVRKSGGDPHTTNNKMELTAVIRALEEVSSSGNVNVRIEVYTDSKYVKKGITSWIHNWIKNGWNTASKQPVKNKELWMKLKELSDKHNVTWKWVKGHAGNHLNEVCDAMVKKEMEIFL